MLYYHDYGRRGAFAGAGISYAEIAELVKERVPEAVPLSFEELVEKVPSLAPRDRLLVNMGPHAWYFHYLRKRHGRDFSIIRDARTTFWSGYLLQESLLSDDVRDGDVIYFPSEFTRQAYIRSFPHITEGNSCALSPVCRFLPEDASRRKHDSLNLGWVGSLSREKGFDAAVKIFVCAYQALGRGVKMVVCGGRFEAGSEDSIRAALKSVGVDPKNYRHVHGGRAVSLSKVYDTFRDIDVLLFPSTANTEAMPRVVLEASHFGIPILASDYAQGYGLIPAGNLLKTEYVKRSGDLIDNQPLGSVDVMAGVEKLKALEALQVADITSYRSHPEKFVALLTEGVLPRDAVRIGAKAASFLKSCRLDISFDEADPAAAEKVFLSAAGRDPGAIGLALCRALRYKACLAIGA